MAGANAVSSKVEVGGTANASRAAADGPVESQADAAATSAATHPSAKRGDIPQERTIDFPDGSMGWALPAERRFKIG
jgi:hypothetical protein